MTTQTDKVIEKYHELCSYCDTFFTRAISVADTNMECRLGCGDCCILETVCELEAYVISQHPGYAATDARDIPDGAGIEAALSKQARSCAFLENGTCTIYSVRPVICRTHGLPLQYRSENRIECCPRNFPGVDIAESFTRILFDAEAVTEALMRLNAAFLISRGEDPRSLKRIHLDSLKKFGR